MRVIKPLYPKPSTENTLEDKLNEFSNLLSLNQAMIKAYEEVNDNYSTADRAHIASYINQDLQCVHAILLDYIETEFNAIFHFVLEQQGGAK